MNNIISYALSADTYYRLWLVAQNTYPDSGTNIFANTRHNNDHWHPELVKQFDDVRDVPATIEVEGDVHHQIDSEGRFHAGNNKPTIEIDKMTITWGNSRANGPNEIAFSGIKMWHHQDFLHRRRGDAIIVNTARFNWNTRPDKGYHRDNGPYQVMLSVVTAKAKTSIKNNEVSTHIHDVAFRKLSSSWAYPNGSKINTTLMANIVEKHKIKMNYLSAGNSVFMDPGEEFIFWNEIGGNL